jgi:hypothetical protein
MIDVVASACYVKGKGPEWLAAPKHAFAISDRPALSLWIGKVGPIVVPHGMDLGEDRVD